MFADAKAAADEAKAAAAMALEASQAAVEAREGAEEAQLLSQEFARIAQDIADQMVELKKKLDVEIVKVPLFFIILNIITKSKSPHGSLTALVFSCFF